MCTLQGLAVRVQKIEVAQAKKMLNLQLAQATGDTVLALSTGDETLLMVCGLPLHLSDRRDSCTRSDEDQLRGTVDVRT